MDLVRTKRLFGAETPNKRMQSDAAKLAPLMRGVRCLMRSIYVHYRDEDESDVKLWLQENATQISKCRWQIPQKGDPKVWLEISADYSDWEQAGLNEIRKSLPGRSKYVCADISGRIPGNVEARMIALGLLEAVPVGIATDDYTSHGWAVAEIRNNELISGRSFFDYK